jgi:hypothetical protein
MIKCCRVTQLFLIILLLIISNSYAQNQQGSSSDLGAAMGNVLNEALQETLEEALPGSTTLKTPDLFSPTNGQSLTHFPRNITFTWEQIPQSTYEIELDCLGCVSEGKWSSDTGQSLAYANNIKQPFYNYEFSDDRMGRWRVRAVRNNVVSNWSEWSFFNFSSGMGSNQQTDTYGNQDPNSGWGQQPADPYGQDPYQDYGDSYPQDGMGQQGDYPGYEDYPSYEAEQPTSNVPIAGENPNQGAIAPPQSGHPPIQVNTTQNNTNESVIKKIPKSILVKPATNPNTTSSDTQSGNKKSIYGPLSK